MVCFCWPGIGVFAGFVRVWDGALVGEGVGVQRALCLGNSGWGGLICRAWLWDFALGETSEMAQFLEQGLKYCSTCGEVINARAEICPHCGVRQFQSIDGVLQGRNRIVAALLAIFLGSFGVHKFYLGQITMGVIYLIFFWSFVPGLIGFVEGIVYLTMTDTSFEERYGTGV